MDNKISNGGLLKQYKSGTYYLDNWGEIWHKSDYDAVGGNLFITPERFFIVKLNIKCKEFKPVKKTVIDWFKENMPEQYRVQAIKNLYANIQPKEKMMAKSLAGALTIAFDWDGTKEGYRYWHTAFKICQRS